MCVCVWCVCVCVCVCAKFSPRSLRQPADPQNQMSWIAAHPTPRAGGQENVLRGCVAPHWRSFDTTQWPLLPRLAHTQGRPYHPPPGGGTCQRLRLGRPYHPTPGGGGFERRGDPRHMPLSLAVVGRGQKSNYCSGHPKVWPSGPPPSSEKCQNIIFSKMLPHQF